MALIESCVGKLTPEQVWARSSANQNAVGNLLLHLTGNVRQWILHGVGGQPDHRNRDAEFAARDGTDAREMLSSLRAALDQAVALCHSLPRERLPEKIQFQGYDVTVLAAIYHVVEHFAGHTFQIIYATKQFTGEDLAFHPDPSKTRGGHGSQ